MRRQTILLTAALLGLALAGCATFEPFTAPDVTLVDIRFEDLTVFETSGTFTVRLSNENPDPMVVDGAVYKLYLGGQRVGKALTDARVEVPRLGSSTYDVDVYINNVALVARLLTLGEQKGLDYTVKGKLYVERPYGLKRMRFSRDGRIDFDSLGGTPAPAGEQAAPLQPVSDPSQDGRPGG